MIVPFNSLSSALWAVDQAYQAWDEACKAHAAADILRRLSAEHDRLWQGYMTALFPNLAPKGDCNENQRSTVAQIAQESQPVNSAVLSATGTVQAASSMGDASLARSTMGADATELVSTSQVTRKQGRIASLSGDYGYIDWEGESLRFPIRQVMGGVRLHKGDLVAFTMGEALTAIEITLTGHTDSEAAYQGMAARKQAFAKEEQSRTSQRERIAAQRRIALEKRMNS